ncbi:MAG: MauE/DoxX family redox-associated membrane protein [Cyanobacteria bacterium P01_F01_bin.150]
MLMDSDLSNGLQSERSMLRLSIAVMRIMLGLFFVLSATSNLIHFYSPGGFFETVTQGKLLLWGMGFEGIGPLPPIISLPYAYLLPPTQILVGVLMMINRFVRWAGIVMMLMLFSFLLAFGLIGPNGLLPNNQASWDKNTFMLFGAWICVAYDQYQINRRQKAERLK